MKKILNFIKEKQYLIYLGFSLIIFDLYLRYLNRTMNIFSVRDFIPNAFTGPKKVLARFLEAV